MIFERGFLLSLFLIDISQGFAAGVCRFNLFLINSVPFPNLNNRIDGTRFDFILYSATYSFSLKWHLKISFHIRLVNVEFTLVKSRSPDLSVRRSSNKVAS